jgi:hypothetical protein
MEIMPEISELSLQIEGEDSVSGTETEEEEL